MRGAIAGDIGERTSLVHHRAEERRAARAHRLEVAGYDGGGAAEVEGARGGLGQIVGDL